MKDCDPYAIVKLQCFPCVVTVVHLLKQESPESTKLPELFQPFLRFAEDIHQMFFCLGRNLFFESHRLQRIQPFCRRWVSS